MSGTNAFSRVLSLRDRKRNTSKTRIFDINNLFTIEEKSKKLSKEEEKKAQEITQRLAQLGVKDVPEQRIEYALRARSSQGDVKEALRLLLLYEDSVAGILRPFDPTIRMLGAENREKTTCFIDSLLFAMFAKSDVFEAILFNNFDDEPRKKLVVIMRLWVNLLRTGRLIPTDIVSKLQDSLAECGWADAAKLRQQDASETFAFITDKLELPLLTLKTDIYHSGKVDDKDDHKFITERMLDVAIPENVPQGEVVTLEMCLEEYFNNRVEVKRHLQRRATANSTGSRHGSIDKGGATFVEAAEVDPGMDIATPLESSKIPQRPLHMRERTTSIFSDRKVATEQSQVTADGDAGAVSRQRSGSVKKEVLMPAWQFLNLIPWYADAAKPDKDVQVKQHFRSKRPMLGICLKRYAVNQRGFSYRLSTHVDIPLEMATPHFAGDDNSEAETSAIGSVKLSLQSVVCHRGHSVDAGHYISFVRAGKLSTAYGIPQEVIDSHRGDSAKDLWLRFDDLAKDRVIVADIQKALQEESPYLLFYRVQPLEDEPEQEEPPAYEKGAGSLDMVDSKLALYDSSTPARASFEPVDLQSRRGSVEVASPEEARGRVSFNSARPPSLQPTSPESLGTLSTSGASIRTLEQLTTEPTTPSEGHRTSDPLSVSTAISRESMNGRPPSSETNGNGPEQKRFSMSISRMASRLSSTKLNNPNIVVNEIHEEPVTVVQPTPIPPTEKQPAISQLAVGKGSPPHGLKSETKTKEKKRSFMSRSRRGSGQKGSAPDRECVVM